MYGKYSMPFLLVDYDQGAGGEFFCAKLSQSPQCVPLEVTQYDTGRSKIQDRFGQEFLKPTPTPEFLDSDPMLYELIPAHRSCHIAKQVLSDVRTIRIASPDPDSVYWQYLLEQRKKKVLLAPQPEGKYFIGELKVLADKTGRSDWIRYVNKDMDNLTLQMLADGIEPTDENKKTYLADLLTHYQEPEFDYDLVIPYEQLFTNIKWIEQQIKSCFGIDIVDPWLDAYRKNYEEYNQPA